MKAPVHMWLTGPLDGDVKKAVRRLAQADDVVHVAVMPDVHLAHGVPIGAVMGTTELVYPQAVGNDIGCGMTALRFELHSDVFNERQFAERMLAELKKRVPIIKHASLRESPVLPDELAERPIAAPIEKLKFRNGLVQLGTLGRGNHFIEFQADECERVWVTIHSGSRGIGQAIANHHLSLATPSRAGLKYLSMQDRGEAYVNDMNWALRYATANRMHMLYAVCEIMADVALAEPVEDSLIDCHHNHLRYEQHGGRPLWVHRKGAAPAGEGEVGIIPGSMGDETFHVVGRGNARALNSSSHGAGRVLSRTEARRFVRDRDLMASMAGVWFDHDRLRCLRDEAPQAYKDIRKVMRAQRELVRITQVLRPLLNFKG